MITFRKAIREQINLIIAVCGGTGSGKTFSAMRIAAGISNGKNFAVIDTENGRANHYADQFSFDTCKIHAPFHPDVYAEAIAAADKAGYPVIVVDSMSHEWAGEGGVLDLQEDELDRMAGDDWKKREACKMAAWVRPKMAHKGMMNKLLQVKAHIILAFRAEEKIEMVRVGDKMEVRKKESLTGKDGWIPICEKNVPFEATCSFLLLASKPGIPHPIKLQEQMRKMMDLAKPLNEDVGRQLAQWAKGEGAASVSSRTDPATSAAESVKAPGAAGTLTPDDSPAFIWRVGTKHKGESIRTIPDDYLTWFAENGKAPDHVQAANDEIDRRMGQANVEYPEGEDVA